MHDLLNLSLLRQMANRNTRKGSINLQPLDEDRLRDEAEGGDFFEDAVVCGFVEDDGVLGFVLDFALGPFLFGFGFSASGGCCGFCFGLCVCMCEGREEEGGGC